MPTTRPWIPVAAGAAAVVAVAVGALLLTGDGPDETNGDTEPTTSATPSGSESESPSEAPSESPTAGLVATPVYYVGDTPTGPRLFREFHDLERSTVTAGQVSAALEEAVGDTALDPDYRSPWPDGTTVTGVNIDGSEPSDVVWIDLSNDTTALHDRPADLSEPEARMAVEQLIHTAQAVLQQRQPVQLMLDGQRTDTVLGVATSEPLAEGDPMDVQGTVWVIDPQDGATVGTTFTVKGRGAFFEANVSWQLLRGDDVVKEGFATAEEGMTLSPYEFTVEDVPPGDYVLRVYDADMSGGEGNGEAEDTKRVTVE